MPRRLAIALLVLVAIAVAGLRNVGPITLAALAPRRPFDRAATPPAPRYDDPAAWSALPWLADAADAPVAGLPAAEHPEADVFYVHPSSYLGRAWNASIDDATTNAATDAGATRIQATAFDGCCAVYAPRYRQANLTAFTSPSDDGTRALALAGDDVVEAFRFYLDHWNRGRPFVIAGHSQGAIHALRVLREVVVSSDVRDRLVAAYLIGSPLGESEATALLPACDGPAQTGCIVAWNARSAAYRDGIEPAPLAGRLCVNPLTWRHDGEPAPASRNHGAVFFERAGVPAPRPGFASARCVDGTLQVELAGVPPRDFASRLLDRAMGDGNYQPIEVGLFFVDLRENAIERVRAFGSATGG